MTIGSILLSTALFLVVCVYVLRPILVPDADPETAQTDPASTATLENKDMSTLLTEKAALIDEIKSLEFDFETGKLPEGAFVQERWQLVTAAAKILQQIDKLERDA